MEPWRGSAPGKEGQRDDGPLLPKMTNPRRGVVLHLLRGWRPSRRGAGHRGAAGSHGGSHADERLRVSADLREQRAGTRPRSRTVLNGSGRPRGYLRIRRLGVRVVRSAPRIRKSGAFLCEVRSAVSIVPEMAGARQVRKWVQARRRTGAHV